MPLPTKPFRRAYHFDSLLELRDYDAAAVSTTTSETGVEYAVRDEDTFKVVVHHAAIGGTVDGSNYWTVNVEVSDAVDGTYNYVASCFPVVTGGEFEMPISGKQVAQLDADAAFIRVTATLTGTTAGDLTYGAYVTPSM